MLVLGHEPLYGSGWLPCMAPFMYLEGNTTLCYFLRWWWVWFPLLSPLPGETPSVPSCSSPPLTSLAPPSSTVFWWALTRDLSWASPLTFLTARTKRSGCPSSCQLVSQHPQGDAPVALWHRQTVDQNAMLLIAIVIMIMSCNLVFALLLNEFCLVQTCTVIFRVVNFHVCHWSCNATH